MIINLTPHDIVIYSEQNTVYDPVTRSYKQTGELKELKRFTSQGCARVGSKEQLVDTIDSIEIYTIKFSQAENLPVAQDGIYYIVSAIVKNAHPDRKDLLVPCHSVRNQENKIIGCLALAR